MITFKEFLAEKVGVSYLYHNTSVYALKNIIETGYLGRNDPISLTRSSRYNSAPGTGLEGQQVRFVFDRNLLSRKYKIKPFADRTVATDFQGDKRVTGHEARWESEERVYKPISINDNSLVKIELSKKAAEDIKRVIANNESFIENFKKRKEKLKDGYFWHNIKGEYRPLETDVQKKHHNQEKLDGAIANTQELIDKYKNLLKHSKLVIVTKFK